MSTSPDPEMRRGAVGSGTPKSQSISQASNAENNQSELDLQARKLCRRFLLAYDTGLHHRNPGLSGWAMTRERLSDRRANETQEFERDGIRVILTVGVNGDIGELFLNADRADSMLDVLMSDAAIIASLALQWGVPLRRLAHAIKRDRFGFASSPIGAALDRISPPKVPK